MALHGNEFDNSFLGTQGFNFKPFSGMPGASSGGQSQGGFSETLKNLFTGGGSDSQGSFGQVGDFFTGGGADNTGGFGKLGDFFGGEGFGKAAGVAGTLGELWTGFMSNRLAKDELQFKKRAFNKNFGAQVKDYENTLKDRWAARNASAQSRGQNFGNMDQWVSSRAIKA